jgi:hypothetical protein
MGIFISAFASTPRDLSDDENAAIDDKSFALSHGNWKEHLCELLLSDECDNDISIDKVEKGVDEYIDHHSSRVITTDYIQWHMEVAQRLKDLITVGRKHECDLIGLAG